MSTDSESCQLFSVFLCNTLSWEPNDCDVRSQLFQQRQIWFWACEQRQVFPLLCLWDGYVSTALSVGKQIFVEVIHSAALRT